MEQITIKTFIFNDFQENTYVVSDSSKECIIIDPGCNTDQERSALKQYIELQQLNPVMLVNTHCHIDHVLGNSYVSDLYKLSLFANENEKQVLDMQTMVSNYYGVNYHPSPIISSFLKEGEFVSFGSTSMKILYVPGHSPGHICLYHEASKQLIAGDALFHRSIGRTDLPGGHHDTLIERIKSELFTLPRETKVYSGHGITTTIGEEIDENPFF